MRLALLDTHAERAERAEPAAQAGPQAAWQLQGDAGLAALAQRLRGVGGPRPITPALLQEVGLTLQLRPYQLQGVAWLQYLREQQLAGHPGR